MEQATPSWVPDGGGGSPADTICRRRINKGELQSKASKCTPTLLMPDFLKTGNTFDGVQENKDWQKAKSKKQKGGWIEEERQLRHKRRVEG